MSTSKGVLVTYLGAAPGPTPPAPAGGKFSLVDGVNFCYETTYTDANYKKKGWKSGACAATFNKVVSTSHEKICKGHSEENIKYCPASTITILVTKKGVGGLLRAKNTEDNNNTPAAAVMRQLLASAAAAGPVTWTRLGAEFPLVLNAGLSYEHYSDTVVAATMGRGIYTLKNAKEALLKFRSCAVPSAPRPVKEASSAMFFPPQH